MVNSINTVSSIHFGRADGGANVGTSLSGIKKGDILVIDAATQAILSGTPTIKDHPVIQIVSSKEDGVPTVSAPIYGKAVTAYNKIDYNEPKLKKVSIGVPTTIAVDTEFEGTLVLPEERKLNVQHQLRLPFYAKAEVADDDYAIANAIVSSIALPNDSIAYVNNPEYVTAIVKGTGGTSAAAGTSLTGTIVKGSNILTMSAPSHGIDPGEVVDLGTLGLFKAVSIDGASVHLDKAALSSVSFAADAVKVYSVVPTSYAVEIAALPVKYKSPYNEYSAIDFSVHVSTNLAVTTSQAYVRGTGTGWQARDLECKHLGWMGYSDRNDTKRPAFDFQSDLSKTYGTLNLAWNAPVRGDLASVAVGPSAVNLMFDGTTTTQYAAVHAILDAWQKS